ncbi:nucleotidyltransferase domain-containing protein [Halobacillus litoralis]|uniref:nucleotidyltransferase domain-containing protein n=1 Tax=Halobacillus litoralis TaxID=45668 RepID=UPI001CFE92B7|nr:hypothetical protein [Halobacillus litoralis]
MFQSCIEVKKWLEGFQGHWMIAGGWAVDLHIGEVTREHENINIAVFREDQMMLYQWLEGWEFLAGEGEERIDWRGERHLKRPTHEIHAFSPGGIQLDFLLNEKVRGRWRFRSDDGLSYKLEHMHRQSEQGIPYLNPEIVLLYKSTHTRKKDLEDFLAVFPYLNNRQKEWLKQALMHHQPQHPWLEALLY